MKRWLINLVCILIALAAGGGMFILKYQVIEKEEELFRIHRQIAGDKREIHMLKGDWASLNDPERLRALVENQTDFQAFGANQVIDPSVVPARPIEEPVVAEENAENTLNQEGQKKPKESVQNKETKAAPSKAKPKARQESR